MSYSIATVLCKDLQVGDVLLAAPDATPANLEMALSVNSNGDKYVSAYVVQSISTALPTGDTTYKTTFTFGLEYTPSQGGNPSALGPFVVDALGLAQVFVGDVGKLTR